MSRPTHPTAHSRPFTWLVPLLALLVLTVVSLDAQNARPKTDAQGDLLPKGALARLGTLRFRHDSPIISQAASPDGRWFATGGRTVRVWDAATGKQVHMFSFSAGGRTAGPSALAFSADGKYLAALGSVTQGVVTVWDVTQGQQRFQITLPPRDDNVGGARFGQPEDVPLLAITPSGVLVKNYGDRVVRLFDPDSGQEVRTFQDAGSLLTAVACSPDGNLLAAGTDARHVVLWEIGTGKETRLLPHDYGLVSLAFSPDSRTLASLDQDLSPILWDVKAGTQQTTLPAHTRTVGLVFSHDGQSLLVARQPDEILSWDIKTKQEHRQRLPKSWVLTSPSWLSVAPAPGKGADRLLIGSAGRRSANAKVRFLELTGGEPQPPRFDGYENGSIYAFYLTALRQWAKISTVGDNTVRLWDADGRVARSFQLPIVDQQIATYALAPDGRRFCLGTRDGRVYVVDAADGKVVRQIQAFPRSCNDTGFTADGRFLIVNDLRTAKVFDVATGKETKSYELYSFDGIRAPVSGDGSRQAVLVYNQDDDQPLLRVFDAPTGKVLSETRTAMQQNTFYVSYDGRNLIFLSTNRGVRGGGHLSVVEVASGKQRLQVELPSPYVYVGSHARISPDGRWLVSTANGLEAEQHAAVAWRLGEKGYPVVLQGHRGSLTSVFFSTDARELLTVSLDSTMVTWDLASFAKPPTAPRRNVKELQKLWVDLNDPDAAKAFLVIHQLADQPDAVPWLGRQLVSEVHAPDPDRVRDLIEKLDAAKFGERQKASDELGRLGHTIAPLLRDAMAGDLSPEAKGRLQKILEKAQETGGVGGTSLQATRAVEAIELAGTPAALEELTRLARRTDAVGEEARAASLRLKQRVGKPGDISPAP